MALVDLDNFIESLMWMWNSPKTATFFNDLKLALDKQGLAYKDGKIIKTQRRISAEAKENGYGESEDEIVKLADEYYNKVLLKECDMEEKEAHHCRIAYIHGAKAMLERLKWRPSEEQMIALDESADIVGMFTQRGFRLISLYNDLKKLKQQSNYELRKTLQRSS